MRINKKSPELGALLENHLKQLLIRLLNGGLFSGEKAQK